MALNLPSLAVPQGARRLDTHVLADSVYQVLRDAIIDGDIPPYTHLVQNEIATQLGVSRTPVREACIRLSQDGLVRAVPGRGFLALDVTERDITDVYEIRLALETLALRQTAALAPADLVELRRLHELIARTEPSGHRDYYELHRRFHLTLVGGSTNRLVLQLLEQVWNEPISQRMFAKYVHAPDAVERMLREHEEIVSAAEAGDRERLLAALEGHIAVARDVTQALGEQPGELEKAG